MAKKWYPVVDILSCVECGTCVNFCSHGVYDKEKVPSPVVVNPDGCVDHCHGCGNKCPVGAITYVGDDILPNGKWSYRVPMQVGRKEITSLRLSIITLPLGVQGLHSGLLVPMKKQKTSMTM